MMFLVFILAIPGAVVWVLGGLVAMTGMLANVFPPLAVLWVPCWIVLTGYGIVKGVDAAADYDLRHSLKKRP